jgi:hypothetical protein
MWDAQAVAVIRPSGYHVANQSRIQVREITVDTIRFGTTFENGNPCLRKVRAPGIGRADDPKPLTIS